MSTPDTNSRDDAIIAGLLALIRLRQAELDGKDDRDPADLNPELGHHSTGHDYLEVRHENGSHK